MSNRVSTILVGDPTSRPTIKVSATFTGAYLLVGHDTRYTGLVAFYHWIKNLVLDTTTVLSAKRITILEWCVSRAKQLAKVMFNMPGATGHVGLTTPGQCTQLLYNDLQFVGGKISIALSVTQVQLNNMSFKPGSSI